MTNYKHHFLVVFLIGISLFVTVWANATAVATTEASVTEAQVVAVGTATEVKSTEYNESAIPLNLKTAKVAEKTESSQAKTILGLAMVLVVFGGGYWFVKKYAQNKLPQTGLMQIKVIAQHYLGPKKSIAVIRVAGESMVVGITDNQINLIKSLAILDEDYKDDYKSVAATQNAATGQAAEINETNITDQNDQEDFSFADLKTTVAEKVKSLRSFQ